MSKHKNFGIDHSTHHLLEIREPPPSIIALREELPKHPKLFLEAQKGATFEECIGIIAAHCDIALDGLYTPDDIAKLCGILVDILRYMHIHPNQRHKFSDRLVNAELVERAGSVTVEQIDRDQGTIVATPAATHEGTETKQ